MKRRAVRRVNKLPACPACGAASTVPIVYGLPAGELFEAAERGEVVIGGCVVGRPGGDPRWSCPDCRHRW